METAERVLHEALWREARSGSEPLAATRQQQVQDRQRIGPCSASAPLPVRYGGIDISKSGTKIIFSNGLLDPWHGGRGFGKIPLAMESANSVAL